MNVLLCIAFGLVTGFIAQTFAAYEGRYIIAIRLFGKKELSQLSVIDLVFILLISNAVQNAMVGDNTSIAGGIAAATTLFCLNYVLNNIIFRSKKAEELIQGEPIMLIYH